MPEYVTRIGFREKDLASSYELYRQHNPLFGKSSSKSDGAIGKALALPVEVFRSTIGSWVAPNPVNRQFFERYPKLPRYKRTSVASALLEATSLNQLSALFVGFEEFQGKQILGDLQGCFRAVGCMPLEEFIGQGAGFDCDLVFVSGQCNAEKGTVEKVTRHLKVNFIPIVFVVDKQISTKTDALFRNRLFQISDFVIGHGISDLCKQSVLSERKTTLDFRDIGLAIEKIRELFLKKHLPKVSIISVLYGKERELPFVLESYGRQTYQGEIEFIFVDDQSKDKSVELVEDYFDGERDEKVSFKLIRNEQNLGNCLSRNKGISEASGDLLIIIDADCLINAGFVEYHVATHSFEDCDVCIGPLNIETGDQDPIEFLRKTEANPDYPLSVADLQDKYNLNSFLNCVTRNFSIKKEKLFSSDLFDPEFSYSEDPQSGFGWEDIEMGYRLYKDGLRIKFDDRAFSVHVTHPPSVKNSDKSLRSLKNFRRMYEKHPEMAHLARRWSLETYEKICQWVDKAGLGVNEDRRYLDNVFRKGLSQPKKPSPPKKPLRILTYPWHVPHQYELYQLPHLFTSVTDLGTRIASGWDLSKRPMRGNLEFKSFRDIDPLDYDVALLHFDENILAPERTNGWLGPDWGKTFKHFMEEVDLPKVAICHGTPQFFGQFDRDYSGKDLMQPISEERERLRKYVGEMLIICNSHQAQREWDFERSKVIWHGFDPTEFASTSYKKGILSPFGPDGSSRPHYQGYFLYQEVFSGWSHESPSSLNVWACDPRYAGNEFAVSKFQNYIDDIRNYSIYFNPTLRSPMPRSRGEAMICGLATVSHQSHDVDMFIENGTNGFYASSAEELREYLDFLSVNPESARKMGQAGRSLAADIFNHDRFLLDWHQTLKEI